MPVAPLKTILPIASAFVLVQGFAELIRCVICLRQGEWPQRLHDVEEIEAAIIAQREHELEREMHLDGPAEGGAK